MDVRVRVAVGHPAVANAAGHGRVGVAVDLAREDDGPVVAVELDRLEGQRLRSVAERLLLTVAALHEHADVVAQLGLVVLGRGDVEIEEVPLPVLDGEAELALGLVGRASLAGVFVVEHARERAVGRVPGDHDVHVGAGLLERELVPVDRAARGARGAHDQVGDQAGLDPLTQRELVVALGALPGVVHADLADGEREVVGGAAARAARDADVVVPGGGRAVDADPLGAARRVGVAEHVVAPPELEPEVGVGHLLGGVEVVVEDDLHVLTLLEGHEEPVVAAVAEAQA